MTDEQLQAIRARRAAITPGTESGANLIFITNSRADVDALLAEVDRLRGEVDRLRAELEETRDAAWQEAMGENL